jgi:MerR family transcriptional regulator, light-induced transcriptional regulator
MGSFFRQETKSPQSALDAACQDAQHEWPAVAKSDKDGELRSQLLAQAVEYEIIPRLMLAHRQPHECTFMPEQAFSEISPQDVREFAQLVLRGEDEQVQGRVNEFREQGLPVQSLFLDLLAPVARHLGDLWDQDLCNFTDVTLALGRLQRLLRDNTNQSHKPAKVREDGQAFRILLLPCPGEQHTFGLSLVAELFHSAGWDVSTDFSSDPQLNAQTLAQKDWYDVMGFSLGSETNLPRLSQIMQNVRKSSMNRRISIIVGGPLFVAHPEYADQICADAIITNGKDAPELAAQLVAHSNLQA